MKTISAFSRRPGLSREAFRDYYETRHAPLGMSYFPFTKYVRNHVVEPEPSDGCIDCISEFYVDDWAASAELTKASTGELFAADEQRFMDRSHIRSAVVEEHLLQGPARAVERKPVVRRILCLDLPTGTARQARVAALKAWGAGLPVAGRRVTLDLVTGPAGDAFPYDALFPYTALISIWALEAGKGPQPLPPGEVVRMELLAEVCESSPELIAELYGCRRA